jgi:PAS domain S-box-containing protein
MEPSFFEGLVSRSRDAIVTIDTEGGILFANEGVERLLGHDPAAIEGKPLTRLMPDRFRDRHRNAVTEYLTTGERSLDWDDIEFPGLHADGHEVPLSIRFDEHEHRGERVLSGVMRDISGRVERERELAAANERLEQQNERLEQFAAVVSHDLRDPLNTTMATLSLLEAEIEPEGRAAEYVATLETSLDRMELLIQGVLTLAKSGRTVGEPTSVDLERAARRSWELAGAETATLSVRTDGMTVTADEERLRALLENLFRNAVQHGPRDGGDPLHVEVGRLDPDGWSAEESDTDGFYVEDDGVGIPTPDCEAVFERGYSTTNRGTGLGLSIVRAIAEAHDWSVTATESEAGGARFEFHTAAD